MSENENLKILEPGWVDWVFSWLPEWPSVVEPAEPTSRTETQVVEEEMAKHLVATSARRSYEVWTANGTCVAGVVEDRSRNAGKNSSSPIPVPSCEPVNSRYVPVSLFSLFDLNRPSIHRQKLEFKHRENCLCHDCVPQGTWRGKPDANGVCAGESFHSGAKLRKW
jgi:hypothetical protein